jgi:hypothetical protein
MSLVVLVRFLVDSMNVLQPFARGRFAWLSGATAAFVLAATLLLAQGCSRSEAETPERPVYGTIEAQTFIVRSADGKRRAEFGLTAPGRFELVIYDESEKRRATLGEQGLMLFGADEKPQARLDLMGDEPRLNFLDADGRVRYTAP